MAGGLAGLWVRLRERLDRVGRAGCVGVATLAVGMVVVAELLLRRVLAFVGAGFRAVLASGEDPAGLVLTWAVLGGFALVFAGVGSLGLSLRRLGPSPSLTANVLVATPVLVGPVVALRFGSFLPLPARAELVRTTLATLSLAVAWVALGRLVSVWFGGVD